MPTAEHTLITAGAVAERLHVSHSTVLRETRAGTIPHVGRTEAGTYLYDPGRIERLRAERLSARQAELDALRGAR